MANRVIGGQQCFLWRGPHRKDRQSGDDKAAYDRYTSHQTIMGALCPRLIGHKVPTRIGLPRSLGMQELTTDSGAEDGLGDASPSSCSAPWSQFLDALPSSVMTPMIAAFVDDPSS